MKYKFRFASKFAKHLHQPVTSIGVRSYIFSRHLTCIGTGGGAPAHGSKGVWRQTPSAWRFWGVYYQNIPFLGTFQLKFCIKTFDIFYYCIHSLLHLNVAL